MSISIYYFKESLYLRYNTLLLQFKLQDYNKN